MRVPRGRAGNRTCRRSCRLASFYRLFWASGVTGPVRDSTEDATMARATAIGLMSGTSYDGVDVALIETDGEEIGRLGPTGYRPYSGPERGLLRGGGAAGARIRGGA